MSGHEGRAGSWLRNVLAEPSVCRVERGAWVRCVVSAQWMGGGADVADGGVCVVTEEGEM